MRPGLSPRTPLGELLAGFKGPLRRGSPRSSREGEGRGGKGKGGEEQGRRRNGGKVDSDAQLEQGRRLAKTVPGQTRTYV